MSPRAIGRAAERRFLLATTPDEGPARLVEEDVTHALRVLRLVPGDRLVGLDGRGTAWPLCVSALARDGPVLEQEGAPRREPAAGEPGSGRARLELVVALPRGERALAMAARLTELGASRLVPWVVERSPSAERELSAARRRRLERAFAEALKQCGRLWLPELGDPLVGPPAGPLERTALLDPEEENGFLRWAQEQAAAGARSLTVLVGPEGGLTPAEREQLVARGARPLSLARATLRIETAAEAAAALVESAWSGS